MIIDTKHCFSLYLRTFCEKIAFLPIFLLTPLPIYARIDASAGNNALAGKHAKERNL